MNYPPVVDAPRPPSRRPLVFVAVALFLGIFIGRYVVPAVERHYAPIQFVAVEEGERQIAFPTFWDAWDILHEKFNGELNNEDLFYGAVAGMVSATGDPYTVFSDPESTRQFEQTIEGSFSGVGIEIGMRQGLVTVIAPLDGSPAQQAGVRESDIIVAIDNNPITQEMTLDDVVTQIRGRRGTKVVLTVLHKGADETEDVEITRDRIEIESVKYSLENGIAHITITNFNSDTSQRFTEAARAALNDNARGIILDVRNNPGGFLNSAVEIASRFLPQGTLVVSERGKESTEYHAEGNTLLADIPVVVLVNEGSASASEILAGALKDEAGVPVVGTTTFGKGSVQEFLKLDDGSSIRVTVAKWFTPGGQNINEAGIEPTLTVEQDFETDADEPLDAARTELEKLLAS